MPSTCFVVLYLACTCIRIHVVGLGRRRVRRDAGTPKTKTFVSNISGPKCSHAHVYMHLRIYICIYMYELLLPVALMFRLEMSYFPMPFLAQASDDPARSHKGFSRALRFRWLVRTTAEHRYAGIVVKELETSGHDGKARA